MLVHGALRLGLALFGVDEHPALRHAPIGRRQDVLARALQQRFHRLGIGIGQRSLGCGQGAWDTGAPRALRVGQPLEILCAVQGTVRHQVRCAIRDMELLQVLADDLPEVARITRACLQTLI